MAKMVEALKYFKS